MVYTQKDITFSELSPIEFENLCYDMLMAEGFHSVKWNRGGADGGRDLEAALPFSSPFTSLHYTKWFFECKHYTSGVSPESLSSKITWADAEQPDFLVIFLSTYLTKGAKEWVSKIQTARRYKIIIVEGEELKTRLVSIQHLIPKYFSAERFMTLYQDMVRHNAIYHLTPSMEMLMSVINNIQPSRFQLSDIGFLLKSFYKNIHQGIHEGTNWNDWTSVVTGLPKILFNQLRNVNTQTDISPFFKDYDKVDSHGFMDIHEDLMNCELMNFYQITFIYNYSDKKKWETGYYLLIINDKKEAFELLTSNETISYHHKAYDKKVLSRILRKFADKGLINEVLKLNAVII